MEGLYTNQRVWAENWRRINVDINCKKIYLTNPTKYIDVCDINKKN